jgi:hypothetical protein
MINSEYKNESKLISALRSLINMEEHQPLVGGDILLTKTPDLTEIHKQIFFPLTSLHMYRKESLLTKKSTAYLNSVHPTKLRVNLNEGPSKELPGLR